MPFDTAYATRPDYFGVRPSLGVDRLVRDGRVPPGPALDLACGDGRNAKYLAARGFRVSAVDISPAAITRLRRAARARGLPVSAAVADIRDYPLPRERFALVVAASTLGYLSPREAVGLAHRISACLRRGGLLYCEEFTTEDPGYTGVGPRSEFAELVRSYFVPEELPWLFPELQVVSLQRVRVLDAGHGRPHEHDIVRFVARRP
jgi:tellurite methyltransferase